MVCVNLKGSIGGMMAYTWNTCTSGIRALEDMYKWNQGIGRYVQVASGHTIEIQVQNTWGHIPEIQATLG